ncbi:MAG: NUDIX domain-containing protein [Clostridia bacterium]|jgi:8-oxo-dGTP pyrophosphatase MutT (NUDIX family)
MNKNYKTLWKGEYVSVISPKTNPYESLHEPDVVIILPQIIFSTGTFYIVRKEFCPPYFIKENILSNRKDIKYFTLISGKIEEGENIEDCVKRELLEETGISSDKIIDIHSIYKNLPICKSTDMRGYFYYVTIKGDDNLTELKGKGDGTKYEELSQSVLIDKSEWNEVLNLNIEKFDLLFLLGYHLVNSYIKEN